MADNLARQLQAQPQVEIPRVQPQIHTETEPAVRPKSVPFSHLEKGVCTALSLVVIAILVGLVSMQTNVTSVQRHLQTVQTQTLNATSENINLKQQIGELTRADRLSQFAQTHGLTMIEGNIRNVK